MTDSRKNVIYDMLVEKAGALESQRADFLRSWPKCVEYRFMGHLGFGGKIYFMRDIPDLRIYVACYPEDRTSERDRIIAEINAALGALTQ